MRFLRRNLFVAALAALVVIGLACSAITRQEGGLFLIVQTNLRTPEDFDELRIEVFQIRGAEEPRQVLDSAYATPGGVTLPTSLTIAAGATKGQRARIRATGSKGAAPVVVREVLVDMPSDRVAELRVLLASSCVSVTCADGETCLPETGTCGSSFVDVATLPDYSPNADLGAGTLPAGDASSNQEGGSGDAGPGLVDAFVEAGAATTFSAPETYGADAALGELIAGNFYGDNRVDIISLRQATVTVFENVDGGFPLARPYRLSGINGIQSGVVKEIDTTKSGQELVVASSSDAGAVAVVSREADGGFAGGVVRAFGAPISATISGAVLQNSLDGLLFLGADGGFVVNGNDFANALPVALAGESGDVGNLITGGSTEVVISVKSEGVRVYTQKAAGWTQEVELNPAKPRQVRIGDLDGDGKNDLVVLTGGLGEPNSDLLVYRRQLNDFALSWSARVQRPVAFVLADFNKDGRVDVAVSAQGEISTLEPAQVIVFENQPSGAIDLKALPGLSTELFSPLNGLVAEDFDKDGLVDIAVSNQAGSLLVFRNTTR